MQRLSPGVYRGQAGGLVQSKTGMIPRKPKLPGVGMDVRDMANKMAGGQMKPTNVPNRNVQPMPRGGFGEGSFQPPNVLGGIVRPGGIPPMNPQGTPSQNDLLHTMPFNGAPQPGKGQPNMQEYLKQFDQGQADISGLEGMFGQMRDNMKLQGLLGGMQKLF